MKIAIVSDSIYPFSIGGSEIRNYEIAKRLVEKGHEIHIFGVKSWSGPDKISKDKIILYGVSTLRINKNAKRIPLDSLKFSLRLFKRLLKEKFDLIDVATFNYFNCYLTKGVNLINKTPLVFTWHQYFDDYLIGYFGKLKGTLAKILEKYSLKLSANNLCVSNSVKNELIKQNVSPSSTYVINNGVDFKTAKKSKPLKKKYDIIFVGRLTYQ